MNYSLNSARSSLATPQLVVELRAGGLVVCVVEGERPPHAPPAVAFLPHSATTDETVPTAVAALAEHCRHHGIATRTVSLLLPRSMIALKTLSVPPCPAAERATLVRLAVAGRSSLPIDELACGFLSADPTSTAAQEVVVATLPRRLVEQWRSALQAVGFTLVGASVTGVALAQAAVAAGVSDGIVVHMAGDEAYAIALQAGLATALTQATLTTDRDSLPAQLATLVRRLPQRASHAAALPTLHVSDALPEGVVHELHQHLADTCTAPQRLPDDGDPRPLAIRGWLAGARTHTSLNLLAPARNVERRRLPAWMKWSAAAIIVLGALGLCYLYECHVLDEQLARLQQRQRTLAAQIERGKGLEQSVTALRPSVERRVQWTRELGQLVEKLPTTEVLVLKQLRGEVADANGIASLRLTGQAQDSRSVTEFEQTLLDDSRRTELFPHGMRPASDMPGYGVQFDLELKVREHTQSPRRSPAAVDVLPQLQTSAVQR